MKTTKQMVDEDYERVYLTDQIYLREYEEEMRELEEMQEFIIKGKGNKENETNNVKDQPIKIQGNIEEGIHT